MIHYKSDRSKEAMAFLRDIEAVCLKHDLSIGYADQCGGFIVSSYDKRLMKLVLDAAEELPDE